jgi:isopropylmalate/homocitrate/citramalate synthase
MVTICDVAPRDGLQNDPRVLAPSVRAELCARLVAAGFPRVEAASFVHPRLVPAMAGAEEVIAGLDEPSSELWTGLVLNERGYDRAVATGMKRVNYTLAATEAFSARNQGCTRDEALATALQLARRARQDGVSLTVTVAVAFGCPFEGRVAPRQALAVAAEVAHEGPQEVYFADTIGVAVPSAVTAMFREASSLGVPLGGHFHDTRNTGIANCVAALESGCALLDASTGGVGGCPFAPGASGNVASEDLVYLLDEMGVRTGVDLDAVLDCSEWLGRQLGRALTSAVGRAGGFPAARVRAHCTGKSSVT